MMRARAIGAAIRLGVLALVVGSSGSAQRRFNRCPPSVASGADAADDPTLICALSRWCDERGQQVGCCRERERWDGHACVCDPTSRVPGASDCCAPGAAPDGREPEFLGLCCPRGTHATCAVGRPERVACCAPGEFFDGVHCAFLPDAIDTGCVPAASGGMRCANGASIASGEIAEVRVESAAAQGGLSDADAAQAAAAHRTAFETDYREVLVARFRGIDPSTAPSGTLRMEFRVDELGHVRRAVATGRMSGLYPAPHDWLFPPRRVSSEVVITLRFSRPRGVQ